MSLNSLSYGSISGPTGLTGPYPTLYLNPSVNNLNCVSVTAGVQTITGDETINGNLFVGQNITMLNNSKYFAMPSGGEISVFGTPTGATGSTGPYGYYGISTSPSYTAIVNQGLGTKIFEGSVNTNVGLQINNSGLVTTQNNTLDDGSVGNQIVAGTTSYPNGTARGTFSTTLTPQGATGSPPNFPLSLNLSRLGDTVNVSFPALNSVTMPGGSQATFYANIVPIPSQYRPLNNQATIPISALVNGTGQAGLIVITTAGLIILYPDYSEGHSAGFTAGSSGYYAGSGCYSVY